MAGKRASARAAALVAAVLMVSAFTAPAAFADDAIVDPNAPVATESLVAGTSSEAPTTPAVEGSTGGSDSNSGAQDTSQSPSSSNPESGTTESNTDAPDVPADTQAPADTAAPAVPTPTVEKAPQEAPAAPAADEDPWVPQTVSNLYPIECSVAGEDVIIAGEYASAEGENRDDIIVDGEPLVSGLLLKGPGVHTYTYNVWRTAYPDDRRLITKTFTVELCDAPVPSAQVASISATAVDGSSARTINVSGKVTMANIDDVSTVLVVLSYGNGLVSAPLAVDAEGNYSTVLAGEFPDGVYTISAQAYLQQSHEAVPSGTPKSTTVEFKTDQTPVVIFTPKQPTFEALPCVEGAPQTRVVLPKVSPKKGYYTVSGEKASGTVVVPGVVRIGFQFADGVEPPYGWSGLTGFTPEKCAVVVPPVVTPPVVTPPVETPKPTTPPVADNGGHKTPTKVETDGDTSSLIWLAGLAGGLMVISSASALRLVTIRRRSTSR